MIKSAEKDSSTLLQLFKNATSENRMFTTKFNSWKQWQAMTDESKLVSIQKQNKLHTNMTSLLVSGLKDDGTITMQESNFMEDDDHNKMSENNKNAKMTIYEFMIDNYKTASDERLFQFIHLVVNGIREIIVNSKNVLEAKDLCKIIKYDMIKYMTEFTAQNLFEDYSEIAAKSEEYMKWEPYDLSKDYNVADLDEETMHQLKRGYKRNIISNTHSNKVLPTQSFSDKVKSNLQTTAEQEHISTTDIKNDPYYEDINKYDAISTNMVKEIEQKIRNMEAKERNYEVNMNEFKQNITAETNNTQKQLHEMQNNIQQMITKEELQTTLSSTMKEIIQTNTDNMKALFLQFLPKETIKCTSIEMTDEDNHSFMSIKDNKENIIHRGGNQNNCKNYITRNNKSFQK